MLAIKFTVDFVALMCYSVTAAKAIETVKFVTGIITVDAEVEDSCC